MINSKFKIIIKPVSFIAGLIVLLILVSYLVQPSNNVDWRKSKDLGLSQEESNNLDYLVMGDSLANRSVSPMEIWKEYGYTGYNCGVGGQRIQLYYYMLKEILKKQSPKIILFESNALFRTFELVPELNFALESNLKEILPVFQHHSIWKDPGLLLSKNDSVKPSPLQFKGYTYKANAIPYEKGAYVKKTEKAKEIGPVQLHYFKLIIDICESRDIKLVLYSSPSPISWNYEKHNAVSKFADENGLEFIELNFLLKETGIDWENDTYDKGDHLNFSGAQKISKYLADYMYEQNILTDHRQDENYKDWNTELELYLEKCK